MALELINRRLWWQVYHLTSNKNKFYIVLRWYEWVWPDSLRPDFRLKILGFLISLFRVSSTFHMIDYLLTYKRGIRINNIFKIILAIFVALQPLHSYTTININTPDDSNGFQHLHAELCGSKYSGSISHAQKISDLLDRINTAIISDMAIDCVCCDSLDVSSVDLIHLSPIKFSHTIESLTRESIFYAPNVKTLPYTNHVRAPPIG